MVSRHMAAGNLDRLGDNRRNPSGRAFASRAPHENANQFAIVEHVPDKPPAIRPTWEKPVLLGRRLFEAHPPLHSSLCGAL